MAEELLNDAKVSTTLEQVSGERVAEPMGMAEEPPDRARVEPAPSCGEEDGVVRARRELRPTGPEIARELQRSLLSERDDTLLPALAAHVHDLTLEVDVPEVERDCLLAS